MMAAGFDGIYRARSPCARRALHCAGSRKSHMCSGIVPLDTSPFAGSNVALPSE